MIYPWKDMMWFTENNCNYELKNKGQKPREAEELSLIVFNLAVSQVEAIYWKLFCARAALEARLEVDDF